jgi:hypothetical protein
MHVSPLSDPKKMFKKTIHFCFFKMNYNLHIFPTFALIMGINFDMVRYILITLMFIVQCFYSNPTELQ